MALFPYKDAVLATAGLVSLWPGNDIGAILLDAKGVNNGSYIGAPLQGESSLLSNQEGASFKCSGGNYAQVADSLSLDLGDVWTLEAFVKPEVLATTEPWNIMSKGNGAYYARIDAAANRFMSLRSQIANLAESSVSAVANQPRHVVFTKNGAERKVIVQGLDVTVLGTNSICGNTNTPLVFGQTDAGFPGVFKGWLQYLAVYNVAISVAKAKEHFDASSLPVTSPARPYRNPGRGLVLR